MNLYSLFSFILFVISFKAQAGEGIIRIPLNTCSKPAADLMNEKKQLLSYGDIIGRYGKYKGGKYVPTMPGEFCQDVDKLSPIDNKYWQDKKFEATDKELHASMPSQDDTVIFEDYFGAVRELGIFSISVRPAKSQSVRYGLTFGLQVHSSLLKSALLRKAGFYQESPKYLHRIRIQFGDLAKMNEFVDKAFCENGPSEVAIDCLSIDPDKRGFITDKDEKKFSLVLHGAYLEKINPEIPAVFDGITAATGEDIQYFAQSRAFRALAVPFVMGDVGESLNRFSPQAVSIRGGWSQMNFANGDYFDMLTSHADMKWALMRYANLDAKDWDEIVDAGQFPECTVPLVKTLLLHRYKNLVESYLGERYAEKALKAKGIELQKLRSINTSCVKEGKVTTQEIPGYPQRFSHGPRKSPFETGDLLKYLKIATQSAVLQTGINKLSEKLKLQHIDIQKQKIHGVQFGPEGFKLLADTTATMYGVNYNASRMVTTGTFYGSQAPIQLVDSVTMAAGIGAQNIFDGLNGVTRNYGASASYIRSFTHVIPLEGAKPLDQTDDVKWKDLLRIESRLKHLASPLKDGNLKDFLLNLKVGEVFTITDSIGRGVNVGWTSALDSLFGYVQGLSAGVSFEASRQTVLRQIQFSRTKEGLQVYVRDVDSHMIDKDGKEKPNHNQKTDIYAVTFDFNYWINIFKLRVERTKSDLHTDAFLLNYDAALADAIDKEGTGDATDEIKEKLAQIKEESKKMAAALRGVIFQSNVDPLYANFASKQFEIDHMLKIKEVQTKILWHRATSLDQHHEVKVLKTELPKTVDGGTVENKPISIVIDRKGELRGRDYFGLSLESLNAWLTYKLKGNAPQYQAGGANPSMMPFGFAQWRTVRTDTEVTRNEREGGLPTVSVIEHVWGGWNMKRKQMDVILAELKEKVKGVTVANFPLIPDGALGTVDKVDFFKVNSHLSVLPEAIDQIKDLVLAPEAKDAKVPKAKFVARLFQKLSQLGGNKARGQDLAVFNNMMKLIGNGDEAIGREQYMIQCKLQAKERRGNDESGPENTYAWYKGTGYECLASWLEKIIDLSRKFPENDIKKQNEWMTEVLYVLDEQIPLAYMLNYLGKEKFLYYVEIVGFRVGDEDGDDGYYMSNVYGEPDKAAPYANGLLGIISEKSKISPVEFEKQGSF